MVKNKIKDLLSMAYGSLQKKDNKVRRTHHFAREVFSFWANSLMDQSAQPSQSAKAKGKSNY